jgi:hypothetical protein
MAAVPAPLGGDCALHTKWDGDQYCIQAPPPDKGFQIHIGPTNYDNPEPQYIIQPGAETNETYQARLLLHSAVPHASRLASLDPDRTRRRGWRAGR